MYNVVLSYVVFYFYVVCEEGAINQAGNVIYPVGPVGICENGFFQ